MYQFDAESVLMERETNRSTHAVHSADIKTIERVCYEPDLSECAEGGRKYEVF